MWILVSCRNPEEEHHLLTGNEIIVGRQDCDIVIASDKSISRKHAKLLVTHPEAHVGHPHKLPVLTATDVSKFGTVIRNEKVIGSSRELKNGEVILFGTQQSKYKANYQTFVVTTSCLENTAKKEMKRCVCKLGGHIVSDWRRDSDLLIMSHLSVTVKVICALISQKMIVTPEYVTALVKALESKVKHPDPEDFVPPLAESQLKEGEVSFKPNAQRKTLFQGKSFVFLSSKQFKKLNLAVELAGGIPILLEEGTDDNNDDIIVDKTTCVMLCDPNDTTQNHSQNAQHWIQHVLDLLKKHGRRAIPDSEMVYAVLHSSTEKYCNPEYDGAGLSCPGATTIPTPSIDQQALQLSEHPEVLVSNTENTQTQGRAHSSISSNRGRETRHATIKEEPISQRDVSQVKTSHVPKEEPVTPSVSKKRPRQEEDMTPPAAKTAKQSRLEVPQIKAEPVTPKRTDRQGVRDEVDAGPSSLGVGVRGGSSRTGKPAVVSPQHNMDSDDEFSAKADAFDDFDFIPSRKERQTQRKSGRSKHSSSRSPSPKPQKELQSKVSPKQSIQNDAFDDFDRPSRGKRSRSKSPTPGHTSPTSSPKPMSHSRIPNKVEPPSPANLQKKENGSAAVAMSRKANSRAILKEEQVSILGEPSTRQRNTKLHDNSDFLNANSSNENAPVDKDVERDNNFETNLLQSEFASLVAHKAKVTTAARPQNTWKGKIVKNFKRFKKTANVGELRIIGGSDLVVHTNSQWKERDDWFRDELQAESQQNEMEKLAQELFDYEPVASKSKRRK